MHELEGKVSIPVATPFNETLIWAGLLAVTLCAK